MVKAWSRSGRASHLKIPIVDGIYTVRRSTNWSLSSETKKDNELTLSRDAVMPRKHALSSTSPTTGC